MHGFDVQVVKERLQAANGATSSSTNPLGLEAGAYVLVARQGRLDPSSPELS